MTTLDLRIYRGITFAPDTIAVLDEDAEVVDLSGCTLYAQARAWGFRSPVIDLAPTITTAADGIVTIALTDEETAALVPGVYRWDLVVENAGGERLGPYVAGLLIVQAINTVPA
jgi:hypothetical protein